VKRNYNIITASPVPKLVQPGLPFVIALLFLWNACSDDGPESNDSPIDPAFIGVWYASSDSVGFEILTDGTSKTLVVDTSGKLQYSSPGPSLAGAISIALLTAKNGNLTAKVRYNVPGFIDTTVTLPGVYTFSNNNNTVSITYPSPLNGLQSILVFQRSSVGAIVKPRKLAGFLPPQ
jgi:hypothetical protein